MTKLVRHVGIVTLVAVLTVVGVSAFFIAAPALAAPSTAANVLPDLHGGRGFCGEAGLAAAADALGLTTEELQTQFRAGASLADLADKAGVDVADVLAAIDAACAQSTRDAIEQAVTDGTLTRDHADWLLEGLDNGYWGPGANGGGFGFGPHGGHGGPGGRGGFGGLRFGTDQPLRVLGLDS